MWREQRQKEIKGQASYNNPSIPCCWFTCSRSEWLLSKLVKFVRVGYLQSLALPHYRFCLEWKGDTILYLAKPKMWILLIGQHSFVNFTLGEEKNFLRWSSFPFSPLHQGTSEWTGLSTRELDQWLPVVWANMFSAVAWYSFRLLHKCFWMRVSQLSTHGVCKHNLGWVSEWTHLYKATPLKKPKWKRKARICQ